MEDATSTPSAITLSAALLALVWLDTLEMALLAQVRFICSVLLNIILYDLTTTTPCVIAQIA